MREKYFYKIVKHWGFTASVDAFASEDNKKCHTWWGEGSPYGTDALKQSWKGHFLWLNPPFSRLGEVVGKLKEDGAHGILVLPDWKRRVWHKRAWALKLADLRFPTGTNISNWAGSHAKGRCGPHELSLCVGMNRSVPPWPSSLRQCSGTSERCGFICSQWSFPLQQRRLRRRPWSNKCLVPGELDHKGGSSQGHL